jgi:hypothetical protein
MPLHGISTVRRVGKFRYEDFVEEFYGIGSLAVPLANRAGG